jgi:hypothetical protein
MSGDVELEGPPTPRPAAETELTPHEVWRRAPGFFALFDFAAKPTTKAGWAIRFVAVVLASALLYRRVVAAAHPLLSAKPPSPIPVEEIDDYKFKLPERTRREIFAELAAAEIAERQRAISANTWNGHPWSREDDRGYYERALAQRLALKYRCSLTQVYLVLDDALRNHWEGPDGKPLPPSTPPLIMRGTTW